MATAKPVLFGSSLTKYPTDAEGVVTYYVDIGSSGPTDPDVLNQAMKYLPKIGAYSDFSDVTGAPLKRNTTKLRSVHDMRVNCIRSRTTDNSSKLFIDVVYKSRPQTVIEFGGSGLQQSVDTYLTKKGSDYVYKQMKLDYTLKKNAFGNNFPSEDTPFLKSAVRGTRMQFTAALRISSTFYSDELTESNIASLTERYTTALNLTEFIGSADKSRWMVSSINAVSNDGGYSNRLSAEFVYNIQGWDTVGVYTIPFNKQPAILEDSVAKGLMNPLNGFADQIPEPYLPTNGGAGRWPQQPYRDLKALAKFLSRGTFLGEMPTFDQLL